MVQLVGTLIRIFCEKKTILGGGSLRIADDNEALNPCRVQEEPVGECGGLHCNQALGEVNLTFENNYDFCHQPHLSSDGSCVRKLFPRIIQVQNLIHLNICRSASRVTSAAALQT